MAGQLMLINPKKRRKAKSATPRAKTSRGKRRARRNALAPVKGYYPNPVRKRRSLRRYRRNPIGGGMVGGMIDTMKSGAIGALGAVGAKVVANFLPVPAAMKSGNLAPLTQAVIGAGVGALVGKFINRQIGKDVGVGAVTVALYSSVHGALAGKLPGLSEAEYDVVPGMSAYDELSAYDSLSGIDEDMTDTDSDIL